MPQSKPPETGAVREWRITSYVSSYKQFSLAEDISPERITEVTRATPTPSKDGKCKYQWTFYAETYFERSDGEIAPVCLPCCIWDFKGSRWSAYGPIGVFRQLGLLAPESPQ